MDFVIQRLESELKNRGIKKENVQFIKRSVKELGQTVIMVTHDAEAAAYADRALVFADGQITADVANPSVDQMNLLVREGYQAAASVRDGSASAVPFPPQRQMRQ